MVRIRATASARSWAAWRRASVRWASFSSWRAAWGLGGGALFGRVFQQALGPPVSRPFPDFPPKNGDLPGGLDGDPELGPGALKNLNHHVLADGEIVAGFQL